jgi:hypothetical protein
VRIVIYKGRRAPATEGPYPYVVLYQDGWDDFGFKCRFVAELRLSADDVIELGGMRIARGDGAFRADTLPAVLKRFPNGIASMGESVAYYRRLRDEVPASMRARYLRVMRDLIMSPDRATPLKDSEIWKTSFMREAASRHALKRAGVYVGAPTEGIAPPKFRFSMQLDGAAAPHKFVVDFGIGAGLPNRMMLLIGPNGTGKTKCLAGMVDALVPPDALKPDTRVPGAAIEERPEISRVIAVSYNAFDEFPLPLQPAGAPQQFGVARRSRHSYKYCGLRSEDGDVRVAEVGHMLDDALGPVAESERDGVLRRILSKLLGPDLSNALTDDEGRPAALAALSAGQRLVAAIFTNIVGFVEEGSLLVIDEPETHLHPGLLSSVVDALGDLLNEYDSYAIIATHSPFLLQQVPSPYVRMFRRTNDVPRITTLNIESFGEDLGELTRTVLGLADPERDYTAALASLHEQHGSAAAVEDLFPHPLGLPALSYLHALDDDAEEAGLD